MSRVAVVLFNLGGPDSLAAVQPFLRNLFADPAIIAVPQPLRWCLARWIAARRAKTARGIYRKIGGGSPLRRLTEDQAAALQARLGDLGTVNVFVAMRYWHPFVEDVARDVAAWNPGRVVLLPLYPQFSTTTTGSALAAWRGAAKSVGIDVPTAAVGCYAEDPSFVSAHAALIDAAAATLPRGIPWRLLLSAHGLPKRIVERGDPYRWQVERTAAAIAAGLAHGDVDWRVCYQSRVGPLEWIGPSTDAEIERAGRDGRAVVIAPIAFVSEHSETLVELDIEYRALAERAGVARYVRVPAVGTHSRFVDALERQVRIALETAGVVNGTGARVCPAAFTACPCYAGAAR